MELMPQNIKEALFILTLFITNTIHNSIIHSKDCHLALFIDKHLFSYKVFFPYHSTKIIIDILESTKMRMYS
jgi:hypothetical protein